MNKYYRIQGVWDEIIKRLSNKALRFIIDMYKENPDLLTWKDFEDNWCKKYPNESFFR